MAPSQASQSVARKPENLPLTLQHRTQAAIEADRGFVPVEDGPFEAAAVALDGGLGEPGEEEFAEAAATGFGVDEQVFQVDAGFAQERGVVVEEQGEALGFLVEASKDYFGVAARAE